MSQPRKILIVDDDREFFEMYEEILQTEGYLTAVAKTRAEAKKKLEETRFDAVILDQKLKGESGPDDGIDVLFEADMRGAKVILATGYASIEAIERAFALGAYDYVEKTPKLKVLLKSKLRNIMELQTERDVGIRSDAGRENLIRELWSRVQSAEDSSTSKGRALEDLMLLLFRSIPGFERTTKNAASPDEQFDLLVENGARVPPWDRESPYFLVECKNWSGRVENDAVVDLIDKLKRRRGRAKLGFLVAPGGFTAGVRSKQEARRQEEHVVVLVDGDDLKRLVEAVAADRHDILAGLYRRTVVEGA
ncbi:MAG: response regulator [Deltaproteobacteria bacterium]|nr:response regulator [Deltaproteobacteria bacterium]